MYTAQKTIQLLLVVVLFNACGSSVQLNEVKNVALIGLSHSKSIGTYDDQKSAELIPTNELRALFTLDESFSKECKEMVFSRPTLPFQLAKMGDYVHTTSYQNWLTSLEALPKEKALEGFGNANSLKSCLRPNAVTKAMLASLPPEIDAVLILSFSPNVKITETSQKLLAKKMQMEDFRIKIYAMAYLLDRKGKVIKNSMRRANSKKSAGELSPKELDETAIATMAQNSTYSALLEIAERFFK